ncbi:family 43 glycosylhydrolase [Cellulomonas sp. JH27-2]|uniref:glycoside hydrolase family 43 protein n=1 Tax=Cellulomonas sp. JH27-2 TaxID=2774139 RepID=UPI00177DC97B|nr:glycoside hydrolase family 43 protein [Cellulomonas sp. JH27-2]MBD8060331.1 family 43 glycosylhydrolase [Cellulomonas sp. JH27-2]
MTDEAPASLLPTRPVLSGFHPDPSVCRVDDTYYLVSSSFEYAPGLPIHRSTDLVTWELVGHALDRPSQLPRAGAGYSGGIYAPTLRHHDGRFWLVTTNVSDGPGHLLVTAEDAAGPWSEPVRIHDAAGIDPDIAWDDAGTCYLTWSDAGIWQAVLDPTSGTLLSEPYRLWNGTGGRHPEGPHLHRLGAWWFLVIAEGGTGEGHAVSVARSASPAGPFEGAPHNPLLTSRGTALPVQNTGHADVVERPGGTWAALYLGVRPDGYFPGWHVLGRETYAVSLDLDDEGWPTITGPIEPADVPPLAWRLGDEIPADWAGAGVFPAEVLTRTEAGWALAAPDEQPAEQPREQPLEQPGEDRVFVGHRQRNTLLSARAELDGSAGTGGLELRLDPVHAVTVEVDGTHARAVARVGSLIEVLGEVAAGGPTTVELRVVASPHPQYSPRRGPDEIVASVIGADGPVELGRLDGRYLSTEVAGGFTGRFVGLVCSEGTLGVRSYTCDGSEPTA